MLPLEGEHFEVRHDTLSGDYRIRHPTRPHAYAPALEHNHEGAWQHELDEPLAWDEATTLRRLGQPVAGLSPERVRQACEASGLEADALRAGHLDFEPIPLTLADTLRRFKVADELAAFIAQIKSAEPALYAKAEPALQMDLLRRRGMLPDTPLVLFDRAGTQLWTDPAMPRQARLAVVLPDGALERGELLQEVLDYLSVNDPELDGFPGQASDSLPERARLLRQYLGEQAQAIEGPLIEQRYQALDRSANPDVGRLQATFPSVPSPMAEHLLRNLSPGQLQAFRSRSVLPDSVLAQVHWQVQELRLTRACEGLAVDALANADTLRLRALTAQGPLSREAMRRALLDNPLRKPAYDASMRLLGGGRGVRQLLRSATNALRSNPERVRRLFPTYTEEQVTVFLASLDSNVSAELTRLEGEYVKLKKDLKHWVRPYSDPLSADVFERRGGVAKTYADAIQRCWRRETHTLTIDPGHPLNLPGLAADFGHVQELNLVNTAWDADAQTFLSHFKQLKQLRINGTALAELPEAVGAMSGLTHLRLRENHIRLTPQSVEQLGRLSQLELLDLAHNPLELAPDFSTMTHLRYVDLSNAGLEHWPGGLREQADLQELNLRNNHLRTIPPEHLEPAPEHLEKIIKINQATSLSGNRLSAQGEQALDDYWRRLSLNHPEMLLNGRSDRFSVESPQIAQVRHMYPNYATGQCRQFIWNLGAGANIKLVRLIEEYTGLKEQLDGWVFSGGGARQRYMRMDRVLENLGEREDRNMARTRILACWRKETPQKLAADGAPIGSELNLSDLRLPSLPDLDADFGHVGSLKLTGMQLSASPEGFLARFRGVRWLDMSNNQLRELPPALGQMHGLTRLFLDNNQIRLTPETVRVLAERSSLRALWMDQNPLGLAPDFSQIPDIRSVHLEATHIDHWPVGLGEQPLLDDINLSNNQLTVLPAHVVAPSPAELARSIRLSTITRVTNNPLNDATLQQVRTYFTRLEHDGLVPTDRPLRLVNTALGVRSPLVVRPLGGEFDRWTQGLNPEQITARSRQWTTLRDEPGSQGFFQMLADMSTPRSEGDDLQQRVWGVIDSITEANAASAALREEMFTWAGRAACCDRAALSFSNLEVMRMVYRAKATATEAGQGPALLKLARGLFRLDEVEKTALSDIAARTQAINSDPSLNPAARRVRIQQLEEVEIRLAYRYGLKGEQQLALPGQPDQARFIALGRVTPEQLEETRVRILALDNSPEEFQALLSRDFWKDYVTHQYRPQFEALSKPRHEQLAALLEQVDAGQLSREAYEAQARVLQDQLAIDEASLIERLSRAELSQSQPPAQTISI